MTNYVITEAEAEQNGVSLETVGMCKQIRNLAKLDRIKLDESEHRSERNKHLFSYMEYCGLDVRDYIKRDKTFGNEVIVSFHENHKRGTAKENNLIRNKQDSIQARLF